MVAVDTVTSQANILEGNRPIIDRILHVEVDSINRSSTGHCLAADKPYHTPVITKTASWPIKRGARGLVFHVTLWCHLLLSRLSDTSLIDQLFSSFLFLFCTDQKTISIQLEHNIKANLKLTVINETSRKFNETITAIQIVILTVSIIFLFKSFQYVSTLI